MEMEARRGGGVAGAGGSGGAEVVSGQESD